MWGCAGVGRLSAVSALTPMSALTMARGCAVALLALFAIATADVEILYDITDEQYYSMPSLFQLDEWASCGAARGVYCVGTFELTPEHGDQHHAVYDIMKGYSANWINNYNHTRVHRGYCLQRTCHQHAPKHHQGEVLPQDALQTWFSTCVNESTTIAYNLSANLYKLDYCKDNSIEGDTRLTTSQRVFAGFVSTVLALTTVSTILEITLPDHAKKGAQWALSWSLQGSWRALNAAPASVASRTDLRSLDGLRVMTMSVVIVEHVTWITTHGYMSNPLRFEQLRRTMDGVLLANSTLVVQIFFTMSSFLLAHKLLQQRRREETVKPMSTFVQTMINRIIRVSPSYFVVVWFAASWWERMGDGPLWEQLVNNEAAVCRNKWWTHLLYLNNVVSAGDECLIQTWYLAADTQLYALCLILTLSLWRWKRAALSVLVALLATSMAVLFALAYKWRLNPTLIIHRPESVRVSYADEPSFNVLYQSPLANVSGALAGLLLAHINDVLLDNGVRLHHHKVFSWISVLSVPIAALWVAISPNLLGPSTPDRFAAAALAVFERPIFAFFVSMGLLGAMNGVDSAARRFLSWPGWACWARLSFGALLLHMPINKALVASRHLPSHFDRGSVMLEWAGVAALSYLAALPLALLVEIPTQRLHRALCQPSPTTSSTSTPARNNEQQRPLADKANL